MSSPQLNPVILVIRPDKIGDVVLSTPVFEALHKRFPDGAIHVLVQEMCKPLVAGNPFVRGVLSWDRRERHRGLLGFFRLVADIRELHADYAIVLQAKLWPSFALFLAHVPVQIGPLSKWFSYLFFNKGVRQRRSRVEMHEADYNLKLLEPLGIKHASAATRLSVPPDITSAARLRLQSIGIAEGSKFVIVHPGMAGSALNWPAENYGNLAGKLAAAGTPVLITGSSAEANLVERIYRTAIEAVAASGSNSEALLHRFGQGLTLAEFIGVISLAELVIAPSTGPLHIAVALGRKTLSFYSPVRTHSARRWGPYPANSERHLVLTPVSEAQCGRHFSCAGHKCTLYFCMEEISVDEAVRNVLLRINKV